MGMTDAEAARLEKQRAPIEPKPAKLVTREDPTIGNERTLRGIPVAGVGGGAINGTRPGDGAAELERANQEIHAAMMRKARANLKGRNP